MKKRRALKYTVLLLAVFVVLMVFATLFDLDISKKLAVIEPGEYFSSDGFSRFFEIFGEIPLYLFLSYALSVIFWNAVYFAKPVVKYPVCIVAGLLVAAVCYVVPVRIHHYFLELNETVLDGKNQGFVFDLLITVTLGALSIAGVMFTGKKNIKKQLSIAVIILFVAAASQLFTQGLKLINKRVRYRAMNALGDFSYFTPWYSINGFPESFKGIVDALGTGDAVKSFPSGHTTSAGITFTLIAVPYVVRKLNDKIGKIIFYTISIAYTAVVAYARVRMGAHYCTDVLMGGGIAFLMSALSVWLFYRKRILKRLYNYCELNEEE